MDFLKDASDSPSFEKGGYGGFALAFADTGKN